MFNAAIIKSQFPIFSNHPDLIFVDNASTTQKPQAVIQAINEYYQNDNANVHRAVYDLGVRSDELYHSTRERLCEWFQKECCIYTNGTTDGLNKLARSLEHSLPAGANIIVSEMEHHSNLIPWQELCNRRGVEMRVVHITSEGELDLDHFQELLDDQTRLVSLIHISNTLGTINDLASVSKQLEDKNCDFIVDAAQSCALHRQEIQQLDADAIVFGAHKMFGPTGIGVILAKQAFVDRLKPFNYGGGMVTEVDSLHASYRTDLSRFEAGTPPIAQVAGLDAALSFMDALDLGQCCSYVSDLGDHLRRELEKESIRCIGSPSNATGIVSATFDDIHPHDVASFLNSKNIAVRAGHHCTQLIMKKYQIHSSVRFSFSIYNKESEITEMMEAIIEMKEFFS